MKRLVAILALFPFLMTFASASDTPAVAKGLEIYVLDVDGGAATLVVTPEGESILIDSGWPGHGDRDPKRIVHAIKEVAGLDHLDHLVTTHWHVDHYGGVAGLSRLVPIGHFWDRGLPGVDGPEADYPDGPKVDDPIGRDYLALSKGKRTRLRAGDVLPLKGNVRAVVLASGTELRDPDPGSPPNPLAEPVPADQPEDRSDNARSVVLKFSLGAFDFLDCGDLTWNLEKALVVPTDRVGPVDVYQVTHHGMDISNHPSLLRTIRPTVTIMNNGPRKGGSPTTVKRLKDVPSIEAAYQLHKVASADPAANTDPALIANTDPKGGRFVRVIVDPDGASYKVQIDADGPERSFKSK